MFKAIIFDLDGTLVDSSLDFQAIRRDIDCPKGTDILVYLDSLKAAEKREAQIIIERHELEDARAARAMPGAKSLLKQLAMQDVRCGIVTRNSRQATSIKLEYTGLEVEQVLTREDARPKPHPEALIKLSELWNLRPNDCAYVGDYIYDLEAARNAKMVACLYAPDKTPTFAEQADLECRHWDNFLNDLTTHLSRR